MTSPITNHDRYAFKAPDTAIELPGFVESGVTYESHRFYIVFGKPGSRTGPDATIYVRHGGGWESISTRHMIATALKSLIDAGDKRAAFFLSWELFEQARTAYDLGAMDASARFRKAFVDGRLMKRKNRGQQTVKVWIEPEPSPADHGTRIPGSA